RPLRRGACTRPAGPARRDADDGEQRALVAANRWHAQTAGARRPSVCLSVWGLEGADLLRLDLPTRPDGLVLLTRDGARELAQLQLLELAVAILRRLADGGIAGLLQAGHHVLPHAEAGKRLDAAGPRDHREGFGTR